MDPADHYGVITHHENTIEFRGKGTKGEFSGSEPTMQDIREDALARVKAIFQGHDVSKFEILDARPKVKPEVTSVWAATWIKKLVAAQRYGVFDPGESHYTMDEACDITGYSLEELLDNIGQFYALDFTSIHYDDSNVDEDEDSVSWLAFTVWETNDCVQVEKNDTDAHWKAWKAGRERLWSAEFSFRINRRNIRLATLDEVKAGLGRYTLDN